MKLKRTLSILLSAALTISSLPIIAFAESQEDSTLESGSSNIISETNWQANGGTLTLADNVLDTAGGTVGAENGADTNNYIHVSLNGENAIGPGVIYQDSGVTLKESTKYLLSVWLRSSDIVSSDPGVSVGDKSIIIDIGNRGNALSMVGQHTGFKTLTTNTADPNNDVFFISDEWQKFNFVFETGAGSAINFAPGVSGVNGLIFRYANRNAAHQAPFDIDGLALYEVDDAYQPKNGENLFTATENLRSYFAIQNIAAHGDIKGTTTEIRSEEEYYHVAPAIGNNAEIYYDGLDLDAGKYMLSGDFKLSDIDWDTFKANRATGKFFNTAEITAKLDGDVIGSGTLTADDDFVKVKFTFDLKTSVKDGVIALTLSDDIGFDFKDIELIKTYSYPVNEDWAATNDEAIRSFTDDTQYLQFEQADSLKYQFQYKTGATLAAGDYTLSVTMRFNPEEYAAKDYANYINGTKSSNSRGCLVDNGIVVGINAATHGIPANNILIAGADNAVLTVDSFKRDGVESENKYALALDDEWHTFEIKFTLHEAQTLEHYGAVAFFMNIRSDFTIPVQVLDLSLVNTTADEEYTKGIDSEYWSYRLYPAGGYTGATTVSEVFPYYTTEGVGVSAIKPISMSEYVKPGLYTVTGKVRACDDDTTLTATAGSASASQTIGKTWQDIELTVDLRETIPSDSFNIAFDCDYIDFDELVITGEEYNILESWGGPGGEALTKASNDEYLQFEETSGEKYQFHYKAGNSLEAGDYKLSVTMRFNPDDYIEKDYANYINGTKASNPRGCLVDNGVVVGINALTHGYPANHTLTASADNDVLRVNKFYKDGEPSDNAYALGIDDKWHTFDIEFTLKQAQNLKDYGAVAFFVNIRSDFTIPVQVLDISLVETTSGEEYTQGIDTEYWGYNTYPTAGYNKKATVKQIMPYYTTNGMGASSISPMNTTEVFAPGRYTVSGMFKAHNDSAVLTATVNDSAMLTDLSGTTEVSLGEDWRKVTFIVDTLVDIPYTDLALNFTDDIDLVYIEIEHIETYRSIDSVNSGTIIMLLMLKKHKDSITEDNLLGSAVSKASIRDWSYGDQTLTYHKDADGDYLRASNIRSNTAGFTYEPGIKLPAGVYFFSGEFRAANEGEVTRIRVMAGDKTGISEFTNEWKKLEFIFELTKSGPLSIKICGASSALDIQDYEFRNLSLINSDNYPGGYNFFPKGEMPEEGTNGWYSLYGGIYGRVTFTKEDDGNIYLSFVDRALNHDGVKVDTGITLVPGAKYTVSYDIRATNPGEELTIRAFANDSELIVTENASNENGNEFDITHEWRHVESQFMASEREKLSLSIRGGQDPVEDIRSFDFDNVVITKVGGATDEDLYPKGNFDDKNLTLSAWGQSYGNVKFTWNAENGDDGYVTLSERNPMYAAGTFATVKAEPGTTYIISYDIRTTNKGDTMGVRARINDDDIFVSHARNAYGNEYWINDEWMHVESLWTAKTDDVIVFSIRAGSNVETDQKDFDINNLKIAIAP